MAQKINLTSGSVFAGNPITFTITPSVATNPSFHRVIVEVHFDDGTGSYETNKLTIPVTTEGRDVSLDISSALRITLDSYKYTATPSTYPVVSWYIKSYDEYMDNNGEVHTNVGEVYYPADGSKNGGSTNLRCIAGAFSDIERLKSGVTKAVTLLSCKPTDTHEIAVLGESFVYPVSYSAAQNLATSSSLTAPASREQAITKEGAQSIQGHPIYALPSSEAEDRTTFRFINRFGCLESISVPKSYSQKMSVESTQYTKAIQETFNEFSGAAIQKQNDRESWLYQSDPLTKQWQQWYLHEFLMSEHVWLKANDTWLPCTINLEDEITIKDETNKVMYSVSFTAKLGINGDPFASI